MKRCVMFCMLAFLVVWCLNTDVMASKQRHLQGNAKFGHSTHANIKVEDDNTIDVFMYAGKDVQPDNEGYDVVFMLDGNKLRNVKKIQIEAPNNKKVIFKNTFGFNSLELVADALNSEDFQSKFPKGDYNIKFTPNKFGNNTINLTHDFPSTPVITYPENDSTDIPLTFTVEWESLSDNDIDGLWLYIQGKNSEDIDYEVALTVSSESVSIPEGVLQPNTQYQMGLEVYRDNDEYSSILTTRIINFTTGSE